MLRSLCRHRATEAKRRPTSSKVLQKNILLGLVLHFHSWPCDLCPYIQVGWFHFLRSPFWSICELEICLLLIKKLSSEVFTLFSPQTFVFTLCLCRFRGQILWVWVQAAAFTWGVCPDEQVVSICAVYSVHWPLLWPDVGGHVGWVLWRHM